MSFSPLIDDLIQQLQVLPGVGYKTAVRMALSLLERKRDQAKLLANSINNAMDNVNHCEQCRTWCETELCRLCASHQRDATTLCVVEAPADILAIEQSATYRGRYFVLWGHLSPIDGIGPAELKLDQFKQRLLAPELKEVILATNPTVEGEATAHYLTELAKQAKLSVSRIAYGVPVGGELEYIDGQTLAHAFSSRRQVELI